MKKGGHQREICQKSLDPFYIVTHCTKYLGKHFLYVQQNENWEIGKIKQIDREKE